MSGDTSSLPNEHFCSMESSASSHLHLSLLASNTPTTHLLSGTIAAPDLVPSHTMAALDTSVSHRPQDPTTVSSSTGAKWKNRTRFVQPTLQHIMRNSPIRSRIKNPPARSRRIHTMGTNNEGKDDCSKIEPDQPMVVQQSYVHSHHQSLTFTLASTEARSWSSKNLEGEMQIDRHCAHL